MTLSIAARARLAAAAAAAELSEQARSTVPVHDRDADELVELATRLVSQAEEVQRLAVAAAREVGHSWEQVGEQLGTSKQAAHKRFDTAVAEIHEAILFPSRRGAGGAPGWWACPDGLEDPDATLERLDTWVVERRQRYDPRHPEPPVSTAVRAIDERHPGVRGIGLVTDLATRIAARRIPDGVTEEDARILLLEAKIRTYDQIATVETGLRADEARQLAQAAFGELVEIHRGRTRDALTLQPHPDGHTVVRLHDQPIAAIVRDDSADPETRGWWLWGVNSQGDLDAHRGGSFPWLVLDDPAAPAEHAERDAARDLVEHVATDLAKGLGPFAPGGVAGLAD